MDSHSISRRRLLATAGGAAAAALAAEGVLVGVYAAQGGTAAPATRVAEGGPTSGYPPDGVGGLAAALPVPAVTLLDSPFAANQARNTNYLHFVDPDRLLHTFRLNVGLPSAAQPCGGWEAPTSGARGHCTGHLMSALALTYAVCGDETAAQKGRYLVDQLARCQAQAGAAGFHEGYLSAFPESVFDKLEAGYPMWAPYYMIHKFLAGLIDQYTLARNAQALEVAISLAAWVDRRTSRLSYGQMQQVLEIEYGGIAEALANLYRITGDEGYLETAQRFYHARIFDPLARGDDQLAGNHANTNIPKMIACIRLWEETGDTRYREIGSNFWQIVTDHHTYIIGGTGNYEHFQAPDAIAGQLSNYTCENCCGYNMLKLTSLLHYHQPDRVDLLDYYERALFNQMLGEQDPDSPHGFNIYYTGLSPGAFKQQPPFMGLDPNVYSTDYGNFSCDHASGLETHAKFAHAVYSHQESSLSVNLFIPSELTWAEQGLTLRQTTGFPDEAATHIEITSGAASAALRVRIPSWVAGPPRATLNGADLRSGAAPGTWLVVERHWQAGDRLDLALPMRLALNPAPDDPSVQAVTYGPIVLAGAYGDSAAASMPRLDPASLTQTSTQPLAFTATADGAPVPLAPIARTHHQHYAVYWRA